VVVNSAPSVEIYAILVNDTPYHGYSCRLYLRDELAVGTPRVDTLALIYDARVLGGLMIINI
jgi:hypothetical protein